MFLNPFKEFLSLFVNAKKKQTGRYFTKKQAIKSLLYDRGERCLFYCLGASQNKLSDRFNTTGLPPLKLQVTQSILDLGLLNVSSLS